MTQLAIADERPNTKTLPASRHLAVRIWLWTVAAMIFAMVIVGGATRLTESGLSITEWQPILGAIPPLSHEDWLQAFEKFKQIPQYKALFSDLDLSGFKFIYFWEYSHRLLGRVIGLVFAGPLFIFWLKRMIPRGLTLKLVGVLALGGLQGFVGWWMVSSGLTGRIEVAQQRLAIHLVLASLTFAAVVALATRLRPRPAVPQTAVLRVFADAMIVVGFVQIFLGALVAGLRAGRAFNTWPLMDGRFIPPNLFALEPWWRNFVDSIVLVQFQHRMVAYTLVGLALLQLVVTLVLAGRAVLLRRALIVAAMVFVQAGLGIMALVLVVPLWAALLHQAFAMLVLGVIVWHRAAFVAGIGVAGVGVAGVGVAGVGAAAALEP
jgi:heme a synthase